MDTIPLEGITVDHDGGLNLTALSDILKGHGVSMVHGTKANLLLPMLLRTDFEMANVLDLLKSGSVPMVGELENGIWYDTGVNLKRLDFVDLQNEWNPWNYWDYARAQYGSHWNQLNQYGGIIHSDVLTRKLHVICDDILSESSNERMLRKDNLFVKLSIAVMRLKLFDPAVFDLDPSLVDMIEAARRRCFQFIDRFMDDLRTSTALCDDAEFEVYGDSFEGNVDEAADKELLKNILFIQLCYSTGVRKERNYLIKF